ncbi:MAG: hypothetical protein ACE37F_17415 [Nannocystaceae bacterium]|nr:hypothetical protein [bacterium]
MPSSRSSGSWRSATEAYIDWGWGRISEEAFSAAFDQLPASILSIPGDERSEAQAEVCPILYDLGKIELLKAWSEPVFNPVAHVWLAYAAFDRSDWLETVRQVERAESLLDMNDVDFAKQCEIRLLARMHVDEDAVVPGDFAELIRRYRSNRLGRLEPRELREWLSSADAEKLRPELRDVAENTLATLEEIYRATPEFPE